MMGGELKSFRKFDCFALGRLSYLQPSGIKIRYTSRAIELGDRDDAGMDCVS